jgi:hypothetical protein
MACTRMINAEPRSMTRPSHRLYTVVLAVTVFVVLWTAVAGRPRPAAATDPRLEALTQREHRLRADAKLVELVVAQRAAAYQAAFRQRQAQIQRANARSQRPAATPAAVAVRVVELPPVTMTRSS